MDTSEPLTKTKTGDDSLMKMFQQYQPQSLANLEQFRNLFQRPPVPVDVSAGITHGNPGIRNSNNIDGNRIRFDMPQQSGLMLHFTNTNRMSLFSLEKRIDYHLSRIMKGHRLVNFKNSIERLPTDKRICECIIEVLMSSLNLIARKVNLINEAKTKAEELHSWIGIDPGSILWNAESLDDGGNGSGCGYQTSNGIRNVYLKKMKEIQAIAISLEQVVWALNSNKEHIKYVVKVFAVPEQYQRSEFSADQSCYVPLKMNIIQTIEQCQEAIDVCRIIRQQIHQAVIDTFIAWFGGGDHQSRPGFAY